MFCRIGVSTPENFLFIHHYWRVAMKFFSGFLFAVLFTALSSILSAQMQPYTVCNRDTVFPASVCLQIDCGGGLIFLAPCPILIPPQGCFTWTFPAACIPAIIEINGSFYPVMPPGSCLPLAPPNPSNQICFLINGANLDY